MGDSGEARPVVEEKFVELTRVEFNKLLNEYGEYSCSLPSGTTVGKKWFRNEDAFNNTRDGYVARAETKMADVFPNWWQGEYVELDPPHPTAVGIRWRRIQIKKEE